MAPGRDYARGRGHRAQNPSRRNDQICSHFRRGRCRWGSSCRYSHDISAHETGGSRLSERFEVFGARDQYYTWKQFSQHQQASSSCIQMWHEALPLLDGDSPEIPQLIAKDLVSDRNCALDILLTTLAIEQHDDALRLSTASAFLKVITHSALLDCLSVDPYVGTLYKFIAGTNGGRAIAYFTQLCGYLGRASSQTAQSERQHEVVSVEDIMPLILKALYELLRREQRMRLNDDLSLLFTSLDAVAETMGNDHAQSSSVNRIDAMKQMFKSATGLLATTAAPQTLQRLGQTSSTFPRDIEVPGNRHDNDHVDISMVQIFPTLGEIMSDETDYLPSTNFLHPHFLASPIQRYLDSAFRLLRHDIFGPLKDDFNAMLHGMREDVPQQQLLRNGQMRMHLYTKAYIQHLAVHEKRGLEAHISFAPPPQLRNKSQSEQRRWWQESPRLNEGGLICFVAKDGPGQNMVFFIVTEKNAVSGNSHSSSHLVTPAYPPSITAKLASIDQACFGILTDLYANKTHGVLVDIPSLIPATFVPVLQNLKEMMRVGDLAFHRWIVPQEPIGNNALRPAAVAMLPPSYATKNRFTFKLDSIARDHTPGLYIDPLAPHDVDLQAVEAATGLDHGQCQGLVAALTREYALIQGPPGTGKSYLGVKLMQVLLAHERSARLGPILVICYTNHALDQFLKNLLDVGIERIIRIGGQSRTPELEGKNLRVVSYETPKTRTEGQILGMCYSELEESFKRAGRSLAPLHRGRGSPTWAVLEDFLMLHHPNIHYNLERLIEDEDGFKRVGAKDPLSLWLGKARWPNKGDGNVVYSPCDIENLTRQAAADIESVTFSERHALASHWMKQSREVDVNRLFFHAERAEDLRREINDVHDEVHRRTLLKAQTIGITTTGLARNIDMLKRVRSKVVVCEEAAEVMEPHMISALMPGVEHFIQIGDHQQLRPQIQNYSLSMESQTGKSYQLDKSQFERRAKGEPGMKPAPVAQLNVQRRMRPEISRLIRRIYPALQDHESVRSLPSVVGMRENVFWLDHDNMEDTGEDQHNMQSQSNAWEVGMTKALVRHFIRQGSYRPDEIAVLTPYTGQLQKLRTALSQDFEICLSDRDQEALAADGFELMMTELLKDEGEEWRQSSKKIQKKQLIESLRLATVDNFQGEEAKIVIVSLVRANQNKKVGFLRTENRINVLVSRAQHGMFLIGNAETYRNVDMWAQIQDQLAEMGSFGNALPLCCPRHPEKAILCSVPDDFLLYAPEGGCNLQCDQRLDACGHQCQAKCHSQAMHDAFACPEPCPRFRQTCSHPCPKLCGQECGPCMFKLKDIALPCGHTSDLFCHQMQSLGSIQCRQVVSKTVPGCQHIVKTQCCRDVLSQVFSCPTPCQALLPCGHPCPGDCGRCRLGMEKNVVNYRHQQCKKLCHRPYGTCNHSCKKPCHDGHECGACEARCEVRCPHSACTLKCSEPCTPCIEPCSWSCSHRGPCTMPCAAPCNRLPCDKRCERSLACGHQCPGVCGEDCPEEFCQLCAVEKCEARVDLLEFKTYSEIDLNETPIVVLSCGHLFTAESLDGHAGISEVYTTDRLGQFNDLRDISGVMAQGVPSCPDCKAPIRQFSTKRYNRVINRAVIDETSKRFLTNGRSILATLEAKLGLVEENLDESREKLISAIIVPSEELRKRYKDVVKIEEEAKELHKRMDNMNQPCKKLFDAIQAKMGKMAFLETRMGQLEISSASGDTLHAPVFDQQVPLGALMLQIKARGISLLDKFVVLKTKSPRVAINFQEVARLKTPENLAPVFLKDCAAFIEEAKKHSLPRLAIQATMCYARIAVLYRPCAKQTTESARMQAMREHTDLTHSLLDQAQEMCGGLPNAKELMTAIEHAQRLYSGPQYEVITPEEVASIKLAMLNGRDGIWSHSGHWYNCANGHPFAIGECGLPMEQARCPECGSPIGGRNHSLVDGVSRAQEMED